MEEVVRVFKSHHIDVEVHDERTEGRQIDVSFHGELRPEQRDATERVLAYDQGILCAPTAFGKTVVGACLIAKRSVNALILVHRRQLMDQWRERLAAFLALPIGHIGQYGGGKAKRTGLIDVAVIQSLQRKGTVEDFVADYGHVIVDECHHVSAVTFERILRKVLGLTATPTRKDGHQPIIYMQCGPIRFHLARRRLPSLHHFNIRFSQGLLISVGLGLKVRRPFKIFMLLSSLAKRPDSPRPSAGFVQRALTTCSHKSDGTSRLFGWALGGICPHIFILKGGMSTKQRKRLAESLAAAPCEEPRVILATGSYLGEGFDDPRLDTLLLAMPISWKGTLQQYVGRLHRLHDNKSEVHVYDYADVMVPMLARMYKKRLAGYSALGDTVAETVRT